MLIDLASEKPAALRGDVAIIGAGVAGITLARALADKGLHVVLLESGGLDYEPGTADLNRGDNVGLDYYPLDHARLRLFGGTTAIWGGRCAELDPVDFEARPWVPHSGWPFGPKELDSYYDAARAVFGLPRHKPSVESVRAAGVPLPHFSEEELSTRFWTFDGMFDRFTISRCADLVGHPRCTIVIHATVCEIVVGPDARSVSRLDIRAPGGLRAGAVAGDYVLAAGGIENARLLLASCSVMSSGLGNAHDQVGRYFMEHPHARGGRIVNGNTWALLAAFAKRRVGQVTVAPLITPSATLQRRERLLNTSLTIAPRQPATGREALAMRAYRHVKETRAPDRLGRLLWKATKQGVGWVQQRIDPLRPWLLHHLGRLDVALVIRAEQTPNPDSRVRLTDEHDTLGMPKVALDWRTSALDVDSAAGLVAALGRELARLDLGIVEPASWLSDQGKRWVTDNLISAHPIGGYHHMGTTRMASDPTQGVTDAEGRVHGLDNLHIAGSSLFPTSGWANPTLTIVALALRTADRLVARAAARSAPVVRANLMREVSAS